MSADRQKQYEEILREQESIETPPPDGACAENAGDSDAQQELHVLTAVLRRYKALVFPPRADDGRTYSGDEEAIDRLMAQTRSFREETCEEVSPSAPKVVRLFRPLLATAAVLALACAALLYSHFTGPAPAEVVLVNGLDQSSGLLSFPTRGQSDQPSAEDIAEAIASQVEAKGFKRVEQWNLPGLRISPERVPERLFDNVNTRHILSVSGAMTPEGNPAVLILVYDTRAKAVIRHRWIPVTQDATLGERISAETEKALKRIRTQDAAE